MYVAIAIFSLYAGALCVDLYKECIHKPITMADYHRLVLDVHLKSNNIPAAREILADKIKQLERTSYVTVLLIPDPKLKKAVEEHLKTVWLELHSHTPDKKDDAETIRNFFGQLMHVDHSIKNALTIGKKKLALSKGITLSERA